MTSDTARRVRRALDGDRTVTVTRAFPLDDIRILSRAEGGDGRTVEAYAAVFMRPTEIWDQDGHYNEQIHPAAFDNTLTQRRSSIFCLYNHGKTLGGTPSDRWSVPLGVPVDMRTDAKGWLTVTRYNEDPDSERILEAVRTKSLKGMSFTGVFLRSDPELRAGHWSQYGPDESGELPLVTRMEIAAIEYGPTPVPAYDDAQVVGVRSRVEEAREQVTLLTPRVLAAALAGDAQPVGHDRAITPSLEGMPAVHPDVKATPVHASQPLVTPDDPVEAHWDSQQAENAMAFPADLAHMHALYALYDTAGEFADGTFAKSAGHLPHHVVDNDGTPGDHHPDAVRSCLDALPAMPVSEDQQAGARAHLEAHLNATRTAAPVGATNGAGDGTLVSQVPTSSSGRDDEDAERERAEDTWTQLEKHGHAAGEDADGDGKKATSSSGRQPAADDQQSRTGDQDAGSQDGTGPRDQDATDAAPLMHPATDDDTSSSSRSTPMDGPMKVAERTARLEQIHARMTQIHTAYPEGDLSADLETEWSALSEEKTRHDTALADAAARAQMIAGFTAQRSADADGAGQGATETAQVPGLGGQGAGEGGLDPAAAQRGRLGTPAFIPATDRAALYDLDTVRQGVRSYEELPAAYRDRAMRVLEADGRGFPSVRYSPPGEPHLTRTLTMEDAQTRVANLLDTIDDEKGELARRVLVTGNPVYERAFGKVLKQLSLVGLTEAESRALSLGVDPQGGYAVPFQLDPTVILTSNGAINPIRHLARVETITGKEWDGVTSAGVTVTRANESQEVGTGDAAFVQPTVRTTRVQGFVPFSVELDVSWGALRSQMTALLMDAKDIEEATAFMTGNGTAPQAMGLLSGLTTASVGTASTVNTAGTASLAVGDLYALENAMPARFRQQSAYLASRTTYNRFRQLFQALASAAFDSWVRPSGGQPATFNGYPAYEVSTMVGTITSGSQVLVQGDFRQFLIVDRVGMGIELVPHLFGPTNRYPTGQRGILACWFNNSQVLVPNAFRLLSTL